MPRNKKTSSQSLTKKVYTLVATETEAGLTWLSSLTEDVFRDKVLEDLFRKMQKENAIVWYKNIHGRNDKGVDFLIVSNSDFGQRIVGIQVKSKEMTRAGGGSSISSLQVKQECEAAMAHEFEVQANKSRLDNIEVWNSSHITDDAEREFNTPGGLIKVRVVRPATILTLLEKYCFDLMKKVPGCALAGYINQKKNPLPNKIKLLGCSLDPKKHFLEPIFSKNPLGSMRNIEKKNQTLKKKESSVRLADIISDVQHSLVLAPELSGKTYLLDHVECLVAEDAIPVRVTKDSFAQGKPSSIFGLIAKQLGFYSGHEVERISENIKFFLLIDDIDSMSEEIRSFLFSLNSKQIKVFATARRMANPDGVGTFYITGVNMSGITPFLRTLDAGLAENKTFIDRAHSFIGRTLSTSGLPSNPFTISMMLAECQNSPNKFSTPTMGRLIERFVDMQLGSHADNANRVDFETKRELLTKFGGRREIGFSTTLFRKEVAKFIKTRSHPHKIEDFISDLESSGVFTFKDGFVYWSHPTLKSYFWVKNLVANNNIKPILRKLQDHTDLTLSALTGSQMKNGALAIDVLLGDLKTLKLPAPLKLLEAVNETGMFRLMLNDEEEEKWLASLEAQVGTVSIGDKRSIHPVAAMAESGLMMHNRDGNSEESEPKKDNEPKKALELDPKVADEIKSKLEPLINQFAQGKLHVAFNLAALLVNARDTKAHKKEEAIKRIIAANRFLGGWFQQIIELFFADKKKVRADLVGGRIFAQLQLADTMIGDPFLVEVFRTLLPNAKDEEELVMLLDLLLCCGEDDYAFIVEKLKTIKNPTYIVAFYVRVTVLYFFRFHRAKDKSLLRDLLKEIRKASKAVPLLPIS
jgi:hypothetical protein